MRELQRETIGDRRVRLLASQDGRYTVTIEVRGPRGAMGRYQLRRRSRSGTAHRQPVLSAALDRAGSAGDCVGGSLTPPAPPLARSAAPGAIGVAWEGCAQKPAQRVEESR